ncbi:165_t:CDS:2, partial [Cetraspora pellucida]
NGRLHFHAVHFMRTLPTGSVDPNFGRRVRNRRQLNSLQNTWPYGYSMPIAVRYTQDAFSRSGWLWPVDAKGEPLKATSYMAVGFYVAKYVNKKSDMDLAAKAVATSQEAVQNQNEPQLRDENAHNDKSVHGVLNPTYQAGLRRDAVQPDIEAERKKRDEIEAGKSYCSRRFGGATCDDKSAQIYARFDKNDWRIQPAEFYRFHDAEVNTFGYF